MLKKVLSVKGVGLLHDVKGGNGTPFRDVTLIYAENGRGKSTFASLLNSCATRDPSLLEDRVTIDSDVKPAAQMMFGNSKASYENGAWSGYKPEIVVYDGAFVNENVHAGSEVTSSQRANLLDFALGASAVQARAKEQQASRDEQAASAEVRQRRHEIDTFAGAMPTPQFRALAMDPNIDNKIAAAEHRQASVARVAEITRQPVPQEQRIPWLDLDAIFRALNKTLESVHATAAARVTEHLSHLGDANSAEWINKGLEIRQGDECPFCGQSINQNDLISMYQVYFDKSYSELTGELSKVAREALPKVDPASVEKFSTVRARNNEVIQQWTEFVPLSRLEQDGDDLARASLVNLSDIIESLFARKQSAITEPHGTEEELAEAKRLWQQAMSVYEDENTIIRGYLENIDQYKRALEDSTIKDLDADVWRLKLTKLRHTDAVEALVQNTKQAELKLRDAERNKKDARDELNSIMSSTLSEFKDSINEHLDEFHAEFRIAEFSHNYRGKTPRVEYRIQLRGETIELTGGRPTFATALSEGDKKTMGFAFFAASTLADSRLSEKIVVVDDPMSSLDAPRRDHTTNVIEQIAGSSKQLILMAHDEHFLRSMRERLARQDNPASVAQVHLRMSEKRYSDFGPLDLDVLCQSAYFKDYKLVSDVVAGRVNDVTGVASGAVALRPLLEGYLHRKYPGVIPSGITLGHAIASIEDALGTDSPCAAMGSRVAELHQMNRYASQFHHNTQPDMGRARAESHLTIARNGEKILEFIHSA